MAGDRPADLTVIIVSYNTREMTLAALRTLLAQTRDTTLEVVVFDNASSDGSPDAIAAAFPDLTLIRSADNLGFAAANNRVAAMARSEWLLLLNPDTEILDAAIDRLMGFARAHPGYGIYGGRTVFADGRLNPGSAWMRITPWSAFCAAFGLSALFRSSPIFNPEGIGGWQRDTVRPVDIVQGSFFLIRRALWDALGGFDPRYFMYGEEADLCLRAKEAGWPAVIEPAATIIHHAGAASPTRAAKQVLVARSRAALIRDHWPAGQARFGLACLWLGAGLRAAALAALAALAPGRFGDRAGAAQAVWAARGDWLGGFGTGRGLIAGAGQGARTP